MNTSSGPCLLHGSPHFLIDRREISGLVFSLDRGVEGASDLNPRPQEESGPERQSESERPHETMSSDQNAAESVRKHT